MLFKTYFLLEKQHLPVFALNPPQQPLEQPAHASLTGTRCNNTAPQISVKLEIIPCGADFQRPCLTSLKAQLRGWGIFRQCPAAWRLSAFLPGQSWSRDGAAEAEPWVPGYSWWRGAGCHLLVTAVNAVHLSDGRDLGKINSDWIRAIHRMQKPLFAGVSSVCLSWQYECEREVGLVSQGLAGEDKRGGRILKLNDKC